jgi:hypothetical protein
VALADEQLVVQRMAQPVERRTHRRLAETHPLAGPRGAALAHQRVEHPQQVEVERGEIHGIDPADTIIRFPVRRAPA